MMCSITHSDVTSELFFNKKKKHLFIINAGWGTVPFSKREMLVY